MERRDPWADYRRRWRLLLLTYGFFLWVFPGILTLLYIWTGSFLLIIAPMIGAMTIIWVVDSRHRSFRCPLCGELFFVVQGRLLYHWAFASQCRHCTMLKWADPAEWEDMPYEDELSENSPSH
jgi:hypothetical protein